jgi:hypothetical protein
MKPEPIRNAQAAAMTRAPADAAYAAVTGLL